MFAKVIINTNAKELNRTFDYEIPEELKEDVEIGSRVLVPFGNMKKLEEAFVVELRDNTEYKTKKIQKAEKGLSKENIELAKWMAKRYFCNLSDCIKLMLPPGTKTKEIQNRIKEKTANFVSLNKQVEEIEFDIESKKIKTEKQLRVIKFLIENEKSSQNSQYNLNAESGNEQLEENEQSGENEQSNGNEPILMSDLEIITDASRAVIKTLEKNGYLKIEEKQIKREPFSNKEIKTTYNLNFTRRTTACI